VRHFIKAIVQHKGSASHCPAGRGKSHGQPTLILRETNVVAGTPPPAEHPGSLLIGRPCAACRIVHYHTLAVPSDCGLIPRTVRHRSRRGRSLFRNVGLLAKRWAVANPGRHVHVLVLSGVH
jgi:hypothetical protein